MKNRSILALSVLILPLAHSAARADESYFDSLEKARAAARNAEVLREPYVRKGRDLSAEMDRINASMPFGCTLTGADEATGSCDAFHAAQARNFKLRAENNVRIDRADRLLEASHAAVESAGERLVNARLSASNPDSDGLRKLKELQSHYLFEKDALKAFDDNRNSESAIAGFFSSLKDKTVDHERDGIVKRIADARDAYVSELQRHPEIKLDASIGALAVEVPEVSERVLLTEDRSDCPVAASGSMLDRAFASIRLTAADFVDGVSSRTARSDASRCGNQVSGADSKPAQATPLAPVEERSTVVGTPR